MNELQILFIEFEEYIKNSISNGRIGYTELKRVNEKLNKIVSHLSRFHLLISDIDTNSDMILQWLRYNLYRGNSQMNI